MIGMFPSDHVIRDEEAFRANIERAAEIAAQRREHRRDRDSADPRGNRLRLHRGRERSAQKDVLQVRRFTEKPMPEVAEQFVKAGNYFWNSGMFVWGARTLADALREHLPKTAPLLEEIAASYGTRELREDIRQALSEVREHQHRLRRCWSRARKKGEGKSGIYCIPASFGWNDLGSWTALYEHRQAEQSRSSRT